MPFVAYCKNRINPALDYHQDNRMQARWLAVCEACKGGSRTAPTALTRTIACRRVGWQFARPARAVREPPLPRSPGQSHAGALVGSLRGLQGRFANRPYRAHQDAQARWLVVCLFARGSRNSMPKRHAIALILPCVRHPRGGDQARVDVSRIRCKVRRNTCWRL
jgi:hypothetical protein